MLEKALKQSIPSKFFDSMKLCKCSDDKTKICNCGHLSLNEEQEFNHKPQCKCKRSNNNENLTSNQSSDINI